MLHVVAIYLATVMLILAVGLSAGRDAARWQEVASLGLLAVLIGVLRRTGLGESGSEARPSVGVFTRHLEVFALAMAARMVFIAVFNYPAEKIPVVYLVVLTALWVEGRSRRGLGLVGRRMGRGFAGGLILGVAFYFLSSLIYVAGATVLPGVSPNFSPAVVDIYLLTRVVVTAFLLSALGEELLFRGYLQGGAERWIGPHRAVIYSSLLFGLWHTAWGIPFAGTPAFAALYALSYMLFTFLSGIVLGITYRSTGSVVPSVAIHGVWNTLTALLPVSAASPFFLGDPWRSLSFGLTVLLLYRAIPPIARRLGIEREEPW